MNKTIAIIGIGVLSISGVIYYNLDTDQEALQTACEDLIVQAREVPGFQDKMRHLKVYKELGCHEL